MKKIIVPLLLLLCLNLSARHIWLETENFSDKGGWVLDQQFMDIMGSPYLMAHGMGTPVQDASTIIDVPEQGQWHVYVRTFNWTSPWSLQEGPGAFRVKVGGKMLKTVLGTKGNEWMWQYVGKVSLKAGKTEIALSDMTGFNGRCDAVLLTTDPALVPPSDVSDLETFRREMLALPAPQTKEYEMVVVGGGIAGMCAAVAAARLGCKVALVNDRPVLGGNNSAEVRVHLGGHVEIGPNKGLGRMIREFGHTVEGNAQPASVYEDEKKQDFVDAEKNIDLYPCFRAVEVRKDGDRIAAVLVRHIETSQEIWLSAPLFSDCTGDGAVGYLAGAHWRMGREARDEFNESLAPEVADKMTMGASVQWYSKENPKKTP